MLSLILSVLVATSTPCSWDHPGDNPYRNSTAQAATALKDYAMPAATRAALTNRMDHFDYDEVVTITRDQVTGKKGTYSNMRDMHSGHNRLCKGAVTRAGWEAHHVELGLVYCEDHVCVIVPTICDDVSLITRQDDEEPIDISPAAGPGGAGGSAPTTMDATAPSSEFVSSDTSSSPVSPIGGESASGGRTSSGEGPCCTFGGGGVVIPPKGGFVGPVGPPRTPPVIVPPIITPPVTPAISEPGTWCLMLVGLLLVLRRRSV